MEIGKRIVGCLGFIVAILGSTLVCAAQDSEAAKNFGLEVVANESYQQDDADFSVQIGRINAAGAGAIIMIGQGNAVGAEAVVLLKSSEGGPKSKNTVRVVI